MTGYLDKNAVERAAKAAFEADPSYHNQQTLNQLSWENLDENNKACWRGIAYRLLLMKQS